MINNTDGTNRYEARIFLSRQALREHNGRVRTYLLADGQKGSPTQVPLMKRPAYGPHVHAVIDPSEFSESAEPYFYDHGCSHEHTYDEALKVFDRLFDIQIDPARNPSSTPYNESKISQPHPVCDNNSLGRQTEQPGFVVATLSIQQEEAPVPLRYNCDLTGVGIQFSDERYSQDFEVCTPIFCEWGFDGVTNLI